MWPCLMSARAVVCTRDTKLHPSYPSFSLSPSLSLSLSHSLPLSLSPSPPLSCRVYPPSSQGGDEEGPEGVAKHRTRPPVSGPYVRPIRHRPRGGSLRGGNAVAAGGVERGADRVGERLEGCHAEGKGERPKGETNVRGKEGKEGKEGKPRTQSSEERQSQEHSTLSSGHLHIAT